MPLPMVLATAVPKTKAATKFQKAAQATARNGVSTRVETTVAIELAASCQPLENSKVNVRATTRMRRWKLVTGDPEKGGKGRKGGNRESLRAHFWCGHTHQAFLRMTPSITLATSSHLSTAVSMTSKISFHLMICTESVSSSKSWAMSVRQRRSLSFS